MIHRLKVSALWFILAMGAVAFVYMWVWLWASASEAEGIDGRASTEAAATHHFPAAAT